MVEGEMEEVKGLNLLHFTFYFSLNLRYFLLLANLKAIDKH
jgi:hypothetical protein